MMNDYNKEKLNKLKIKRSELHKQALQLSNQIVENEIERKEVNDKDLLVILNNKLIALANLKNYTIDHITYIQIEMDKIGRY
ncbi:hypothetical protein [Lactococcus petauri]|uniref:Uncharacterized protein n=1 Tax=Lactococcus phage WP-2 TaxID=1486423 RepID=A0A024B2L9_9CAUD|nr:hypothetical protein [Lactococcus petauri]YP_009032589.1 hypothetical protein WP2_12 [Lactococcus phage WP-2]AHZ10884.1 hypothetical protein WP2_12 [Lactococcus phage WP-2]MCQ8276812.1 hypothetical protein [Lactococcus petauri]MCR6590484.1 hypothetical protein [Lactococcus petauri]